VQYLNNILEHDHRAIKRRVKAKQGFREFHAARHIIQGYEAMHMIRKGQVRWVRGWMFGGKFSSSKRSSSCVPEMAVSIFYPSDSFRPGESCNTTAACYEIEDATMRQILLCSRNSFTTW
jgi:DDE domain